MIWMLVSCFINLISGSVIHALVRTYAQLHIYIALLIVLCNYIKILCVAFHFSDSSRFLVGANNVEGEVLRTLCSSYKANYTEVLVILLCYASVYVLSLWLFMLSWAVWLGPYFIYSTFYNVLRTICPETKLFSPVFSRSYCLCHRTL